MVTKVLFFLTKCRTLQNKRSGFFFSKGFFFSPNREIICFPSDSKLIFEMFFFISPESWKKNERNKCLFSFKFIDWLVGSFVSSSAGNLKKKNILRLSNELVWSLSLVHNYWHLLTTLTHRHQPWRRIVFSEFWISPPQNVVWQQQFVTC